LLSKKLESALNDQLNAELFSSYLYLSMEAYFESLGLTGFSHWMRLQAQEELMHGLKFYDHINERGGRVILKAIATPEKDWKSPLHVFEAALKHEQKVTDLIDDLMNLALDAKDHASQIFLQWFVTEQVEELASAGAVVDKLKLVGDSPNGLFLMDQELGGRQPESE
jgi:ferritin